VAAASKLGSERESQDRAGDLVLCAYEVLARLDAPDLTPFLSEWPAVPERRRIVPSSVPALRWLSQLRRAAPKFSAALVDVLVAAAQSLAWQRTYTAAEAGAAFLENYGWTELVGLAGPAASARLASGLLLLGPDVTYPLHRHEAEEIYVPLVGTAAWKCGTGRWRKRPPGSVIHHARNAPHAMRTGATALLAVYLWRSENLAQKSRLDSPSGRR
jgi:hypothetical protein